MSLDRIIFITRMDRGGMETVALETLRRWLDEGRSCGIYCSYGGGGTEAFIDPRVERFAANQRALLSFLVIRRYLRERSSATCLCLSFELAVVVAALKALRLVRNRIIYWESTDIWRNYGSRCRLLMKLLFPFFDEYWAQSATGLADVRSFVRFRGPAKVVPIPCRFAGAASENFAVRRPGGILRLAIFGRLVRVKAHARLFAALATLDVPWTLDIYGEGPEEPALRSDVATRGWEDKVRFNGYLENPEPAYRAADCIVISSYYEGMPNVMLEALALGRRVAVSADARGAAEYLRSIGRSAWIVEGDFIKSFKETLDRVLHQ